MNRQVDRQKLATAATKEVAKYIKPGDTVYVIKKHDAHRRIASTFAILVITEGRIKNISALVSSALGAGWDGEHEGVVTNDSYNLLFNLSTTLHGVMGLGNYSYNQNGVAQQPTPDCYAPGKSFITEYL